MADHTKGTAAPPVILSLARDILRRTEEITKYLESNDLPTPTFALESSGPPDTKEYQALYDGLKTSLEEILLLVDGPKRFWRQVCCLSYDLGGLQIALDFEFFTLVPANGSISIKDLAKKAGIHEDRAGRVLRQLITYGVFVERQAGVISHSPSSLIMQDDEFRSMVHYSYVTDQSGKKPSHIVFF